MKNLTLILFIIFSFSVFSQELKPTEKKALLNFLVTDLEGFPRNGELVIAEDIISDKEYTAKTKEDGKCKILVPKGRKYKIKYLDLIEKTNYSDFTVPNKFGLMSFNIQIKFEPSKQINADGVNFKENSANLTYKSTNVLDTIAEVIKNKKLKLEIASHINNILSKDEALELTQQRAETVKNYLISKGVKPEKLSAKGYGFSEPIAKGNDIKNTRIEFRIKQQYF